MHMVYVLFRLIQSPKHNNGLRTEVANFRGIKVKPLVIAEHHIKHCVTNWILKFK